VVIRKPPGDRGDSEGSLHASCQEIAADQWALRCLALGGTCPPQAVWKPDVPGA